MNIVKTIHLNQHETLADAEDEIRDLVAPHLRGRIPDERYDINSIMLDLYEDDGEILRPVFETLTEAEFARICRPHQFP